MLRTRPRPSFSHQTLRRIETNSGGNPFIALELGRALARRGITSGKRHALPVLAALREEDVAEAAALSAQALAEADHDPALASAGFTWTFRHLDGPGGLVPGHAEALMALAEAERTSDPALIASSLAHVFFCTMICGAEEDERQLERALELEAKVSGASMRSSPSGVAGMWHFTQGRLEEAEAELRRMLARAEAHGAEYARADALLRLSLVTGRRGDARRAAELAATGLEIAEQLDFPRQMRAQLLTGGRAALQLGQTDRVRDLAAWPGDRGSEAVRRAALCHPASGPARLAGPGPGRQQSRRRAVPPAAHPAAGLGISSQHAGCAAGSGRSADRRG